MELSQKECSDGGTNCQQELHGIHPAILTYGVETERENVDRVRIMMLSATSSTQSQGKFFNLSVSLLRGYMGNFPSHSGFNNPQLEPLHFDLILSLTSFTCVSVIMGGVQDNECLESEDLMMIVLFIVLFQNQTSNTFGEGTYSII